jgi:hypothetical protein
MAKAEDPSLDPESAAIPQQVHLAGFVAAESAVGASQNVPGSGENTAGPSERVESSAELDPSAAADMGPGSVGVDPPAAADMGPEPAGPGSVESAVALRPDASTWRAAVAVAGVAATAFGVVGAFIQVQNEPGKVWNMAAVLVVLLLAGLGWLWWRRGRARRRRILSIMSAALVVVLAGFVAAGPNRRNTTSPVPSTATAATPAPALPTAATPAPAPSTSAAPVADPHRDQYEHEIWPSSLDNQPVDLPARGWAMTDFRVTLPYLRSIEVAAGPDGKKVLVGVYHAHGDEIASGEAVISGFRAKVIFERVKDVSAEVGGRLYLRIDNLYPGPARVYFTRNDVDAGITSYLPCGRPAVQCPNPAGRDLVALIVGRAAP